MFKKNLVFKILFTTIFAMFTVFAYPYILHKVTEYINVPKIEERFETCATNSVFDMKENNLFDDKRDFSNNFFNSSINNNKSAYMFCSTKPTLKVDNTKTKYIALTFDDGPHKKYTKELLTFLKEKDIKVTFFLLGENIAGNEEILRQMLNQGCEIGIHSYTHKLFTKIPNNEISEQIINTQNLITSATGKCATIIRPPYGSVNSRVKDFINMPIILWHLDSKDWSYLNTNKVYNRIMKQVENYDIVLMHDIFKTSIEAAKLVITDLLNDNYTFVTISQLNELNMQRKKN